MFYSASRKYRKKSLNCKFVKNIIFNLYQKKTLFHKLFLAWFLKAVCLGCNLIQKIISTTKNK